MHAEDICTTIAATQWGLATRAQVRAAGVSSAALTRLAASSRWSQPQPRVLQSNAAPRLWTARALAPVLSRPDFVLSHRSAARVHRFPRHLDLAVVEGVVAHRGRVGLRDVTLHQSRDLSEEDVVTIGPMRATSRERTLVDLGALHTPTSYTGLVDDVMSQLDLRLTTVHGRALALRCGRRNVALLARLTAPDAERLFRSWLEREAAGVFRRAGLPTCAWNERLETPSGRLLGIVDCLWREQGLVVELDGLRFHSLLAQRRRDRARQNDLVMAGYRVLRYTWQDVVKQPQRVVAEIRRALGR